MGQAISSIFKDINPPNQPNEEERRGQAISSIFKDLNPPNQPNEEERRGQQQSATLDNSALCSTLSRPVQSGGRINILPERRIKHYSSSHKILLVGEGDFSFSACLAKAFGTAHNMTATSLDSVEFLSRNYKKAMSNICELERRGCRVMHGVDVHEMVTHYALLGKRFDRIVFNFPHAGFDRSRSESRSAQIERHQMLISGFFDNAKLLLEDGGEIHITHKSVGFFLEWNLHLLSLLRGLSLVEEVKFKLGDYPGYSNKYGFGGDAAFDCNPSKTYKFAIPAPVRTRMYSTEMMWE